MREIKDELLAKLQESRAVVLAKATGLAEYDRRRPLTPTGTNLLGLVKHLTGMEYGYLGECLGRPADPAPPWFADDPSSGTDMWASPEESGEEILAHYRHACAHADETVRRNALESAAHVPWWAEAERDTTLGVLLIRMVAETAQHAGHADIVRELVDGQAGSPQDPVPEDPQWRWQFTARIAADAERFRRGPAE